MKFYVNILFFFFLVSSLLYPLIAVSADMEKPSEISVTDFRGKTLTFDAPPRRIVCLIESALTGIYMLGAQERIVGISSNVYTPDLVKYYADLDARVAKRELPTPGNWDFVNIESVIALSPDLVIIWAHQQDSIAAMEEKGLHVYGVMIREFDDIYKEMADFGILTGKTHRARTLINATRNEIRRFSEIIQKEPKHSLPRVYFMWAQGELETAGRNSSANDLIKLAGGVNVCGHIDQEHLVVNIENILTWNPEVVIMWANPAKSPEGLMQNSMWRSVSAVRQGRVHELPEAFACDFWTLKFQFAVKAAAKWCHPEAARHVDLDAEKQRMFKMLYNRAFEF